MRDQLSTVCSGALAGGLVSIAVQPLDVIRTRMQGDGAKGFVRGTLPTMRSIYRDYGAVGFWRGTTPTVLRMSVGAGLHFLCLELLKSVIKEKKSGNQRHLVRDATIGGMARGGVTIALCPITVIKTRMEYIDRSYGNVLQAGLTIAKQEGIKGLFKGVVPTFLSNAPFSALHYMFYRQLQTRFLADTESPSMSGNFVCSTLAAAAATVITQPADVVRTRMQLGYGSSGLLSSITTLRDIFISQGVIGITLGVAPRMIKRTLQTGLIWALYEEIGPKIRNQMNRTQVMRQR